MKRFAAAFILASFAVTATPPAGDSAGAQPAAPGRPYGKIRHIVIIVQENRTFDNMFNGYPGADSVSIGTMSNGQSVSLQPILLDSKVDIDHSHVTFEREYDGGHLYFDLGSPGHPLYPYSYVPRTETRPYWDMAAQYVLADRMFQSNSGPSYPAHLYLVAGQSQLQDENPDQDNIGSPTFNAWGCDDAPATWVPVLGPDGKDRRGPFPCFDMPTIADELDAANVSWRYYAEKIVGSDFGGVWSAFDAIKHIRYGSDWSRVISPSRRVITDAALGLPSVTWIAPSVGDSDHSGAGVGNGPSWVASVVNAIGNGPDWKSTAIFIVWDDWGGWFDHVSPPQVDNMGLGFRVPMIVVSPYAKRGYVSHEQYEFGSLLKFVEDRYSLSRMTAVDRRANSLDDCFDFSQHPRPFKTIAAPMPAAYFEHERPSNVPADTE